MATSFVKYHDNGFWCNDAYLEIWLYLFVKEAEKQQYQTDSPLRDRVLGDWYLAATVGFMGCIDLRLDEIIHSDEDKAFLLGIASTLHSILSPHDVIPPLLMAAIEKDIRGEKWMEPPLAKSIMKVGTLFTQLLKGELTTKSNSPLTYLNPEQWNKI
jgi:hypothetical protein